MFQVQRSQDAWGHIPAPPAPRINPCPLPEIRSPLMRPPIPIAISPPPVAPRPSTNPRQPTTHRHRPHGSTDEPGYSSSLESSSSFARRPRPTSQVVRTPLAPMAAPLKGILRTGTSESSVASRASLIQQDRDGYTSSPEKATSSRPSQAPRGESSKSRPPQAANTTTNPSIPPTTLHWKLLSFDPRRSKGQLKFDFAREVDEIILVEAQRGPRPLSVPERNKSAGAEPGLTEMVIYCNELPDWPVYIARQSGIRCVDVFEAIHDTYNVVLTNTERSIHMSRVRDIERRRPPTPEGAKKGLRRRDLLDGKTQFLGLDWRGYDSRYPNGCWCLNVGTLSP